MRRVVGREGKGRNAASTSQMGRFETEVLTQQTNLEVLMDLPGRWVDRLRQRRPVREIILDMDSSVSETHGEQEGSAYNPEASWLYQPGCANLPFTRLAFVWVELDRSFEGAVIGNRFADQPAGIFRGSDAVSFATDQQGEVETSPAIVEISDGHCLIPTLIRRNEMAVALLNAQPD